MIRLSLVVVSLFILMFKSNGQVIENEPKGSLETFTYPLFLGHEQHSSMTFKYGINESLEVELQGFYDTYLMENRVRSALIFRQYLTKRLHVLFGGEDEIRLQNATFPLKNAERFSLISGFGYDVDENFLLEVKSNSQIGKSTIGAFGESLIPTPQLLTLGGKIKF